MKQFVPCVSLAEPNAPPFAVVTRVAHDVRVVPTGNDTERPGVERPKPQLPAVPYEHEFESDPSAPAFRVPVHVPDVVPLQLLVPCQWTRQVRVEPLVEQPCVCPRSPELLAQCVDKIPPHVVACADTGLKLPATTTAAANSVRFPRFNMCCPLLASTKTWTYFEPPNAAQLRFWVHGGYRGDGPSQRQEKLCDR